VLAMLMWLGLRSQRGRSTGIRLHRLAGVGRSPCACKGGRHDQLLLLPPVSKRIWSKANDDPRQCTRSQATLRRDELSATPDSLRFQAEGINECSLVIGVPED
jgi:hypothetical protein